MRTGSAPFRPSGLSPQPAETDSADYLALEKDRLVVITPAAPQPKRGLLGALVRPRSDSKDLSSRSGSPSRSSSRTSSASSPVSSQSRSSVSEPQAPLTSGDEAGNRRLLTALTRYADRLKLPADATFHKDIGLLERECAVLPPQEFGRSALRIYAAAKAQASKAGSDIDGMVDTAVKAAYVRFSDAGADFTGFARAIGKDEILRAPGCRLEVHDGRLVVLQSMAGLNASEARLAKAIDAKLRRGDATLTDAQEQLQIKRAENGRRFMRETFAEGVAREDGKYGSPHVQGPVAPEDVNANQAANGPVLEAVARRLKASGVGPSMIAQLRESMKLALDSPPELFAYRLAFRTASWDARVSLVRSDPQGELSANISERLRQHLKSGSLTRAEAPMLTRYAERAFALVMDQDMALQPERSRRSEKLKSLPPGQTLPPIPSMSVDELTDMAIKELRSTHPSHVADTLPPLAPPLPAHLRARRAPDDGK